jgi:hypothetical protein
MLHKSQTNRSVILWFFCCFRERCNSSRCRDLARTVSSGDHLYCWENLCRGNFSQLFLHFPLIFPLDSSPPNTHTHTHTPSHAHTHKKGQRVCWTIDKFSSLASMNIGMVNLSQLHTDLDMDEVAYSIICAAFSWNCIASLQNSFRSHFLF